MLPPTPLRLAPAALLAAALLLAACGSADDSHSDERVSDAAPPAIVEAPVPQNAAPNDLPGDGEGRPTTSDLSLRQIGRTPQRTRRPGRATVPTESAAPPARRGRHSYGSGTTRRARRSR